MTIRQRIAMRSPFLALWHRERRAHALTRADLDAHTMHFALAVAQRDRALDAARVATERAEEAEARIARLDEQVELMAVAVTAAWDEMPA